VRVEIDHRGDEVDAIAQASTGGGLDVMVSRPEEQDDVPPDPAAAHTPCTRTTVGRRPIPSHDQLSRRATEAQRSSYTDAARQQEWAQVILTPILLSRRARQFPGAKQLGRTSELDLALCGRAG
jgi:hypothetical protein